MRGRNLPSGSSSASGANKKLECSRAYKRRAKKEEKDENDVDIISDLPDHILHHIFYFLEMKQAIQTCILSRRWRYFWVSLPTLKFTYWGGRRIAIRNEFMAFVDRVLMFRGNSNIPGFVLLTDPHTDVTDRLNTWILASVIRNVQRLTLRTQFSEKFHFHHCLFTCKSLTKLVVRADSNGVSISFPDKITLPRLKTLFLESVKFEDENSTDRLLSSCPVLESLIITSCEFPGTNVNISSPVLQHLRLSYCRTRSNTLDLDPVDINFQLCAPNLISFSWYNDMSKQFAPKNLSSLVKAGISTIEYEDSKLSKEKKAMYAPFMVNVLRGLHNVEDLTLSSSFLEVVTGAPYLLDSQPTEFCNLRCLKVTDTWSSIDNIHAVSYLLKISPNMETLFVEVEHGAPPDLLEMQPAHFCNLRCLKMETLLSSDCIYAIAYLLKISPQVETLSFKVSYSSDIMHPYWNPDEITSNSAKRGDYWKAGLSLEGLLNHVKCFELLRVTGRVNELEFIEILLKNAMLLEELVIIFQKSSFGKEKELEEERLGRLAKFSEKVRTFPTVSSSVKIKFESAKWY